MNATSHTPALRTEHSPTASFPFRLHTGDYLMVTGLSLQMIFYNSSICGYWWMAIAAAGILALMQVARTLHHASFLCWFNMACITISVLIALIYMMVEGRDENVVTYAVNPDLTVQSFFGAMSRFVFAYSGQFMYLELMSEMKRPQVSIYPLLAYLLARIRTRAHMHATAFAYSMHPHLHAHTCMQPLACSHACARAA